MTISILGAGWLGFPLAQKLLEGNHVVRASTTKIQKLAALRAGGIQPLLLNLAPDPTGIGWGFLLECDVLVINIPPRMERQGQEFHPAQIEALVKMMPQTAWPKKIIYVSSTSVYPEQNREMTEDDVRTPQESAAGALVRAENMVASLPIPTVILRCGGLMGYDRMPGKYVAGKQNLTTGDVPVNYIHRHDAVGIIAGIIASEENLWGQTYNAVAPQHPVRRAVYEKNCADFGLEPPTFETPSTPPHWPPHSPPHYKIVNSDKIIATLPYQFVYPDPLLFLYE